LRTTSPLLAHSVFFAAAVIAAAACSSGRSEPLAEDVRERATADAEPGETGSPPPEAPPPETVSEAAAAIDGLLERGGRLLQERQFDLAVELFEGAMRDSRAAGEGGRLVRSGLVLLAGGERIRRRNRHQ